MFSVIFVFYKLKIFIFSLFLTLFVTYNNSRHNKRYNSLYVNDCSFLSFNVIRPVLGISDK